MSGSDVRFTTRDGETFDGYLTGPDDGVPAPGILLVTAVFGEIDPIAPKEEVDAIRAAFAGRPNADIGVHREAGHNFAMPRKDGYHPAVAKESRERVLRCFRTM